MLEIALVSQDQFACAGKLEGRDQGARNRRPGDELAVRNHLGHPRQQPREVYRTVQTCEGRAYAGQGIRNAEQGRDHGHIDLLDRRGLLPRLLHFQNGQTGFHQPHVRGDAGIPLAQWTSKHIPAELRPRPQPSRSRPDELQVL